MNMMLSTTEAAKLLGVAPSTLRYWRMIQSGPAFIQISPRCVRYDEDDLREFIAIRRRNPSAVFDARFDRRRDKR
jgi:DNA-binding transcriptional MerR regulator